MTRIDLEAALAEEFSRQHLAIYADLLQAEGDPRGELIAIDLRIAEHGPSDVLKTRRRELLAELLGDATAPFVRDDHNAFELGFGSVRIDGVSGARLAAERALMESPLGPYLRHVTIRGGEKHLTTGIATLVRREHRWLRSLHVHYDTMASRSTEPIVSASLTRKLIAATPVLEHLRVTRSTTTAEAAARPVFASFDHPRVRELDLG